MTATETPPIETLSSLPQGPAGRGVVTAAALVLFAVIAMIPWLLSTASYTEAGAFASASSTAPQQRAAPAPAQASAGLSAVSINRPAAYALFCQNSPTLCNATEPTPPHPGYVMFCWNSPVLCTLGEPSKR